MDEDLKKKVKEVRKRTGAPMYMCIDYVKKHNDVEQAIRYLAIDYVPKRKDGDRFYRSFLLSNSLVVIGAMSEMGMRSSSLPSIVNGIDSSKFEFEMSVDPQESYLSEVNQSMTLKLNEDCRIYFYVKDTSEFSVYLHKKLEDSAVGGFLLVRGKYDSDLLSEIHSALPRMGTVREVNITDETLRERCSFNDESLREIFWRSKIQKVWFLK